MPQSYVYMLASGRNGTLYTGVTADLVKRIAEYKQEIHDGFTARYGVKNLVYYEVFGDITQAIQREKNIKAWKRNWKIRMITENNPEWRDLFEEVAG